MGGAVGVLIRGSRSSHVGGEPLLASKRLRDTFSDGRCNLRCNCSEHHAHRVSAGWDRGHRRHCDLCGVPIKRFFSEPEVRINHSLSRRPLSASYAVPLPSRPRLLALRRPNAAHSRSAPRTPENDARRGVATTAPSNGSPESIRRSASASRRLCKVTRPPSETPEQRQFAKVRFPRAHSAFPPAVVQQNATRAATTPTAPICPGWDNYIDAMSRLTRSSTDRNGSLHSTVRWA